MQKIIPSLWCDNNIQEMIDLYTSVFKNAMVTQITRQPAGGNAPEGTILTASFKLEDLEFVAINGGSGPKYTEAVSFSVMCDSQEEVDYYWEKLTADGGEESMCGWLKDKFGLSWQIVPKAMMQILGSSDREKASRAMQAMMKMKKLDIATLEAA